MMIVMGESLLSNCVFTSNGADTSTVDTHGGAMVIWEANPQVVSCSFVGNMSASVGGIFNTSSFENGFGGSFDACIFDGNVGNIAGPMLNMDTNPLVAGSTFCKNLPDNNIAGPWTDGGGNTFCLTLDLEPTCPWDCANADGHVDIEEFLAVLGTWGEVGVSCDLDGGGVGITDLLKIFGVWGPCP